MIDNVVVIDSSTIINLKHIGRTDLFQKLKYFLCTTIHVLLEMENGRPDTLNFFNRLRNQFGVKHVKLSMDDLVEMANVPNSKRISDAELSCFIKAKEMNCKTACDDKKAIKYASRYIDLPQLMGIVDVLIEAYVNDILSDGDLITYQEVLASNKFKIQGSLLYIGAGRKAMAYTASARDGTGENTSN